MKNRKIEEIDKKIKKGDVRVISADDLSEMVRNGEEVTAKDVDFVTTATMSVMSGTAAILSFSEPGKYERAKMVRLNGVPALPGPAPNERSGYVDTIVYGTQESIYDPRYGGGHLFRDLVEGEEVAVEVETTDGLTLKETITLQETNTAMMIGTRSCGRNYQAFTNPLKGTIKTIFHCKGLREPYKECSFAGCGELNPIQNDPDLEVIGIGSKILMNGAEGIILGHGTKSSLKYPYLMTSAEMYGMKPKYMGGVITSSGVDVMNTVAVPIPILDEKILENAKILDEDIELPLLDVHNRREIARATYGMVWKNPKVSYDPDACMDCKNCPVERYCPLDCFKDRIFQEERCLNCGFCATICDAFGCDMGYLDITLEGEKMRIPITYRASNREGARRASLELKDRIERGDFLLSPSPPLKIKGG
jgi:putative methanogenesis marker 16 metalloprotein